MSDLEKFMELYKSVGIDTSVIVEEGYQKIRLTVERGKIKIDGYWGFSSDLCFDELGKFVKQDIYE